jgi:hypothetical protein
MKLKPGTKLALQQCNSCPFREGGLGLGITKLEEIKAYLLQGTNHFCHSDSNNKTICRGGRNYQLEMWYKAGIISAPTDEALEEAMLKMGITPKVRRGS